MGEKRHFEPVKRAEPRFPENPTNHSSPLARRRQKIAPLRHSSPPLRPSRPRRHLPTSFAHPVCHIPRRIARSSLRSPAQPGQYQTPQYSFNPYSHSRTSRLALLRIAPLRLAQPITPPFTLPSLLIRRHNTLCPISSPENPPQQAAGLSSNTDQFSTLSQSIILREVLYVFPAYQTYRISLHRNLSATIPQAYGSISPLKHIIPTAFRQVSVLLSAQCCHKDPDAERTSPKLQINKSITRIRGPHGLSTRPPPLEKRHHNTHRSR